MLCAVRVTICVSVIVRAVHQIQPYIGREGYPIGLMPLAIALQGLVLYEGFGPARKGLGSYARKEGKKS